MSVPRTSRQTTSRRASHKPPGKIIMKPSVGTPLTDVVINIILPIMLHVQPGSEHDHK